MLFLALIHIKKRASISNFLQSSSILKMPQRCFSVYFFYKEGVLKPATVLTVTLF